MQYNILKKTDATKICLQYTENGLRKKFLVMLKFMDTKECYFATDLPINFKKPKKKTDADLTVYTVDGIYKTSVQILDCTVSLQDIMFEVTIPLNWNYSQLRNSTRKKVELPVNIKFDDGFELKSTSIDLALGGVAVRHKGMISSIYKRLTGTLTIELPKESDIDLPDSKLIAEAKFVREITNKNNSDNGSFYVFKFIKLSDKQLYMLTNYLIKLD